jgi:hypothetical protein
VLILGWLDVKNFFGMVTDSPHTKVPRSGIIVTI